MEGNRPSDRKESNLDKLLSTLENRGELTSSDVVLLKLKNGNRNLTVVESADNLDWNTAEGMYYNIVTSKNFDKEKLSYKDDILDVLRIDVTKLEGQEKDAYFLSGELKCVIGGVEGRISNPSMKKMNLHADMGNRKADLSKYRLYASSRVKEFYSVDKTVRALEETAPFSSISIQARLSKPTGRNAIDIIYRTTYSGNKETGSRLYLREGDNLPVLLGKDRNADIVEFMRTLSEVHTKVLKETSCDVYKFSKPDYLSMYG